VPVARSGGLRLDSPKSN